MRKSERKLALKALYDVHLERLSADDKGHVKALGELIASLGKETDRGAALMACAYLDDQLGELLKTRFVEDHSLTKALIDTAGGPLGSFSVRIDVAYLLGVIPKSARRDLHLLRRIRNEFAHNPTAITFQDPKLASRAKELEFDVLGLEASPRQKFNRAVMWLLDMIEIHRRRVPRIDECPSPDLSFIKNHMNVADRMVLATIKKARTMVKETASEPAASNGRFSPSLKSTARKRRAT
jgi:DNA-binding MltR family transcriptional regulator